MEGRTRWNIASKINERGNLVRMIFGVDKKRHRNEQKQIYKIQLSN